MAILLKNIPEKVSNLIYDKQHEFTKAKKRRVSLEQTVAILLETAYITVKKDGETTKET